ncbi:MAG: hypothetical protein RL641_116 [Candidatus Parcubacteria bacterium]
MENQKDNHIKDTGLSKGHVKDALETMDKSLSQSAKRAGNITTALYLVSNILPSDEPLQKEIRKAGLALLSVANDIAGTRGENYDRRSNEINNIIKKIIAYLEVGVTLFLVSEMNFRILRLELMALGGSYESRRGGLIDIESILRNEPVEKTEKPLRTVHNDAPSDKGHIKDIQDKGHEQLVINVLNKSIAPTFGTKNFIKDKSTTFDDRKTKIIKALVGKESSTIAEVKAEFPDVSFKTIQRDLQSLIDEGKIERVGERRWSMYKIK